MKVVSKVADLLEGGDDVGAVGADVTVTGMGTVTGLVMERACERDLLRAMDTGEFENAPV